jgi:hypothetical protein
MMAAAGLHPVLIVAQLSKHWKGLAFLFPELGTGQSKGNLICVQHCETGRFASTDRLNLALSHSAEAGTSGLMLPKA